MHPQSHIEQHCRTFNDECTTIGPFRTFNTTYTVHIISYKWTSTAILRLGSNLCNSTRSALILSTTTGIILLENVPAGVPCLHSPRGLVSTLLCARTTRATTGQPAAYIGENSSGQWHDVNKAAEMFRVPRQHGRHRRRYGVDHYEDTCFALKPQNLPNAIFHERASRRLATRSTCALTRPTTTPTSSIFHESMLIMLHRDWKGHYGAINAVLYYIELYCTYLFAGVITPYLFNKLIFSH